MSLGIAMRVVLGLAALLVWTLPGRAEDTRADCAVATASCLLEDAGLVAETLSRSGDRDEAAFAIATALSRMGRFDDALAKAREISDTRVAADVLGEIAMGMAKAGAYERAHEIALDIPDAREDWVRVRTVETVAAATAASGNVDAAFDQVMAIDNPFRRSQAQAEIALSVARTGNFRLAIGAASRIATDYWFSPDQHQLKIASGLVSRAGEFDQFWFYEALAHIARLQALEGDSSGALQTAAAIPDIAGRSRAMARIGALQATAGNIDAAFSTAARIEMAYGDLDVLIAIVDSRAHAGDFEDALELAQRVAGVYADTGGLAAVALRRAEHGLFDEALETIALIPNPGNRTRALTGVAVAMVDAGRADEALRVTAMIFDSEDRGLAVRDVALRLAALGEVERALSVAAEHARPRDRGDLDVAIAVERAKAGDVPGAAAFARAIENDLFRAIALAAVAPFAG